MSKPETMFTAAMFTVGEVAPAFDYNGKTREGGVPEKVEDVFVCMKMGDGEYRTFRYENMKPKGWSHV